jgi:N-acetylglucosaminyl-diphospho-decaprenol L-rhamnosyltransferase
VGSELEVVVVHHRTPKLLLEALERLAQHAPQWRVVVVDTALAPSLTRQLDGVHPRLSWLEAPNHSYAHAVNLGLKATTAPLVAAMNADVLIEARTFDDLASAFVDGRVALAGPLARTPQGSLQDQGLPYRWHVARLRWRGPATAHGAPPSVGVPWLSGCLIVVRRAALDRVGGMDGSLRFYNEDLEWGLRCRAAGFRNALVATEVIHVGASSTPPEGRFLVEGLRGGYAVTRRVMPPIVRLAHRWGVAAAAAWAQVRLRRDPTGRAAWREVMRRFVRGDLDASPFGPTLGEAAAVEAATGPSASDGGDRGVSGSPPGRAAR